MAVLLVAILAVAFCIIATEKVNGINKAAVAMFAGVSCWLLYLGHGTSFVLSEHSVAFLSYIAEHTVGADSVKDFIAQDIFLKYMTFSADIVLFLLGTTGIVEVLNNNHCFDFIREWLVTRSPRRFLWMLSGLTFLLSANLDNLTTVCLMLSIMHSMISGDRLRMVFGSVIVLSASCGGAFTVIGDVSGLMLWERGLVTPTVYAAQLVLPCFVALLTVNLLVARKLPDRLEFVSTAALPYRGDDRMLPRVQRMLLLLVGIGGLWFIPTFHRITHLPPFVGALCVLSFLWVVNELCNHSLLGSDKMVRKRHPMALQYTNIQHILFFIGITLLVGAVCETGAFRNLAEWSIGPAGRIYVGSIGLGALSALVNNVSAMVSGIFLLDIPGEISTGGSEYAVNGNFWMLLSYCTAMGSALLPIGTFAGFSLMRLENVTMGWYLRKMSGKVLAGWMAGLLCFYLLAL